MNELKNKILVSKRNFEVGRKDSKQTNDKTILRKHCVREEFKVIEIVRVDHSYKYVFITPLLKERNESDKEYKLLYNLECLRSHFYLKSA